MTDSDQDDRLRDSLQRCQECAHTVMAVLERERGLLEQRDPEGLTALMPEKLEALATLEAAERQRAEAAWALGYAPDPEGMRRLLRERSDAGLEAEWQALTRQLQALQRSNEANGRLIHRSLEQTAGILAILTGAPAQGVTYGRDGAQGGAGPGRCITSA
ncbi:flagella synthesis protein FlgN [Alkalilimnicola ehrlichii MLHE-1]|uniref:FlgN family protein n=1 Tax=Alkalilimnicola ehrlichii (strain ATCC BAA-1101 / DSM 17681 / MLHE-1) TaxID=187272 RepID=Q0AA95_ALKEH|nr:flagellar protein FlgN [Alkalilimnicola ehrlichii]ABI56242.1 FlgN family protein [Alkalilimnicola ehrlichii MLHE-1]